MHMTLIFLSATPLVTAETLTRGIPADSYLWRAFRCGPMAGYALIGAVRWQAAGGDQNLFKELMQDRQEFLTVMIHTVTSCKIVFWELTLSVFSLEMDHHNSFTEEAETKGFCCSELKLLTALKMIILHFFMLQSQLWIINTTLFLNYYAPRRRRIEMNPLHVLGNKPDSGCENNNHNNHFFNTCAVWVWARSLELSHNWTIK